MRPGKKALSEFIAPRLFIPPTEKALLPKCSFLFVTYNRCPHRDPSLNPLVWAIQTLMVNRNYHPDEIIIVDDCSNDHTYDSFLWLKERYDIPLRYRRNEVHRDLSYSRNIGLGECRNDLVFMGDDDCLFSEDFLAGSMLSFAGVKSQVDTLAVLNLNVFEK